MLEGVIKDVTTKWSCDDQRQLAKRVAANVGYVLVREDAHPDISQSDAGLPTAEDVRGILGPSLEAPGREEIAQSDEFGSDLLSRLHYHGTYCLQAGGEQSRTMLEAYELLSRPDLSRPSDVGAVYEECAKIADGIGMDITADEGLKPLDVGMAIAGAIRAAKAHAQGAGHE